MPSVFEEVVDAIQEALEPTGNSRTVDFSKFRVAVSEHGRKPSVVWVPTSGTITATGNQSGIVSTEDLPVATELPTARVHQLHTDTMNVTAYIWADDFARAIQLRDNIINAARIACKTSVRATTYEIISQDEKKAGWMLASAEYIAQRFEIDICVLRNIRPLTPILAFTETCTVQAADSTDPV